MGVENCIAIQFLYCREEGLSRQGLYCRIVLQEGQVYCNTVECRGFKIVLQYSLVGSRFVSQYKLYCEPGVGLCRDTARARQLGAAGRTGWRWARRRERHGVRRQVGARARAEGGRGAGARGALARQQAHGRAGWPRLCTWCTRCTRPVFGLV